MREYIISRILISTCVFSYTTLFLSYTVLTGLYGIGLCYDEHLPILDEIVKSAVIISSVLLVQNVYIGLMVYNRHIVTFLWLLETMMFVITMQGYTYALFAQYALSAINVYNIGIIGKFKS